MQCLMRLYKAHIPVVLVIGNHDNPLSFGKAHALDVFGTLPVDGFHVIGQPTSFALSTKSGPVNIVGMPWPTRNTLSINEKHLFKSATEITELYCRCGRKNYSCLCTKTRSGNSGGTCRPFNRKFRYIFGSEKRAIYGTDPVLLPSQLAIKPFDYVGLGHLHRYQN